MASGSRAKSAFLLPIRELLPRIDVPCCERNVLSETSSITPRRNSVWWYRVEKNNFKTRLNFIFLEEYRNWIRNWIFTHSQKLIKWNIRNWLLYLMLERYECVSVCEKYLKSSSVLQFYPFDDKTSPRRDECYSKSEGNVEENVYRFSKSGINSC